MEYQTLYQWGREELERAHIAEAGLDARLLLETVCGTDRNDLLVHGQREVAARQEEAYRSLIRDRAGHIPLQQLTGVQDFMGLTFVVNEHVLIPRQDTELLVEEVLKELTDGSRILDLCTGSGCILLSLLHYSNGCTGTGTDISEAALSVARENAARLSLEAEWIRGDLYEGVTGQYDYVVANPPYIAEGEFDTLMEEVRDHEPRVALDGGTDGLMYYRRILKDIGRYIKRGGWLYFEIGATQAEAVSAMLKEAGFAAVRVVKDYAGLDRVVMGTLLHTATGSELSCLIN